LYLWCGIVDLNQEKMTSKEIIAALSADVERLMKLHDSAMAEVATLREKSSEQSAKIRTLQEQLREAKAQAEKASLHAAIAGSVSNKAAARAQVNRLLREVDHCIEMVSNRI
jgi:multidrug resistance efflux pump